MSLLGIAMLAVSPAAGALAAVGGWRTGERWLREDEDRAAVARCTEGAQLEQNGSHPLSDTACAHAHMCGEDAANERSTAALSWPPLGALALGVIAGVLVGAGSVLAFAGFYQAGAATLGWAFIYAAYVDARARLLPDGPAWAAALWGAMIAWREDGFAGLMHSASGAVSAGAGLLLVSILMRRRLAREALGMGDVKIAAAGGVLLGPVAIWTAVGAGAAATVLWVLTVARLRRRASPDREEIPFGPALLAAIWISWIAGRADIFVAAQ